MGKIYNGADMSAIESDKPKNIEEIVDFLKKIGSLVVERDDVKFRDDEIKRIYNILRKYTYKNVLLVGDYGSGKRSVVEGYCKYLLDKGDNELVFRLDFPEILKIATNPSEFDKIVGDIFYVAGSEDVFNMTINIDNIGGLLNSNLYGNAGHSFIDKMIKYINEETNDKIPRLLVVRNPKIKKIHKEYPSRRNAYRGNNNISQPCYHCRINELCA